MKNFMIETILADTPVITPTPAPSSYSEPAATPLNYSMPLPYGLLNPFFTMPYFNAPEMPNPFFPFSPIRNLPVVPSRNPISSNPRPTQSQMKTIKEHYLKYGQLDLPSWFFKKLANIVGMMEIKVHHIFKRMQRTLLVDMETCSKIWKFHTDHPNYGVKTLARKFKISRDRTVQCLSLLEFSKN